MWDRDAAGVALHGIGCGTVGSIGPRRAVCGHRETTQPIVDTAAVGGQTHIVHHIVQQARGIHVEDHQIVFIVPDTGRPHGIDLGIGRDGRIAIERCRKQKTVLCRIAGHKRPKSQRVVERIEEGMFNLNRQQGACTPVTDMGCTAQQRLMEGFRPNSRIGVNLNIGREICDGIT